MSSASTMYLVIGFQLPLLLLATALQSFLAKTSFSIVWVQAELFLCLPHGGRLQRLRNLNSLRYAAKHADHWYKYVNGTMGLRLANGDLHLVTGCEKAKSWGLVTFHDVPLETNFQLSFRPTRGEAEGYKYRWQGSYGHWKHEDAPPDDGSPLNQTTFIHTFPVLADEGLWQKLLAFAVQQLANYPSILHQLGRFISVANPEPSFPRSLFFGNGAPVRGGHGIVTETFPVPKIFNPSQILHKLLFREVPHARVVIIHTDDWCDAMAELDQDGQQTPEEIAPELERIVFERHEIVEEDGLAYLRRKPDVTSSNVGE
ncbi:hypothetical protein MSAN_00324600 [Mycena sanguinolenta]|uniref:Uncharacterized protein n=1 Tax=Mycena sanguinolenta TaxID=230812 RepID=A0A8H6ZEY3_9AGAR|nr:hypothetical protein MSAN_00324600 [Mycena sanguinolenta]